MPELSVGEGLVFLSVGMDLLYELAGYRKPLMRRSRFALVGAFLIGVAVGRQLGPMP